MIDSKTQDFILKRNSKKLNKNSFKSLLEPKIKNRFVVKFGEIPSYVIHSVNIEWGVVKKIKFSAYGVICPDVLPELMKLINNKNEKLKLSFLGPMLDYVGDLNLILSNMQLSFNVDWADNKFLDYVVTADIKLDE